MKVSFNVQKSHAAFYNNASTFWNMGFNCSGMVDEEMRVLAAQVQTAPVTPDGVYTVRLTWDGGEGFRGDVTSGNLTEHDMLVLEGLALESFERLRQSKLGKV